MEVDLEDTADDEVGDTSPTENVTEGNAASISVQYHSVSRWTIATHVTSLIEDELADSDTESTTSIESNDLDTFYFDLGRPSDKEDYGYGSTAEQLYSIHSRTLRPRKKRPNYSDSQRRKRGNKEAATQDGSTPMAT